MTIDQLVIISLIVAGLLIIGYVFFSTLVVRRKRKVELDPDYTSALEALVKSEEDKAKGYLIDSARKNPSSLSPYLVLGDIFRNQGDLQKAVKIHHELSIRPNLRKEEIEKVYQSLILDYLELEKYDQVEKAAGKLLSLKKKDRFALDLLLKAYEGMGDWDKAIDTAKIISNRIPGEKALYLSRYHTYVGWKISESDSDRAEDLFKKALSLDPDCIPASILMGDVYFREGRYDKSIGVWDKMLDRDPKAIHHVAERLERAYFESGKYSQMMEVYERLHHKIPGDVLVLLGMARMSLKKGDFSSATRFAEEAREIDPEDCRIYQVYLEINEESGDPKPALEACQDFFNKIAPSKTVYFCQFCAYKMESILVRCPECGSWEIEFEG